MRSASALLGVLVGALLGVIGAFLQAQRIVFEEWGFAIPWGAIVASIGNMIVIRGAVVGAGTRWAGWGVILGWLGLSLALAAESPSGDIAISSGARQITYLLITVIVGATLATLPPRLRNPRTGTDVPA